MVNIINGDYGGPGLGYHCFTESTPSDPRGQVPEYDLPGTTCAGQFDQFGRDPYVTHLAHPTHTSGGWDDQAMYNSVSDEIPDIPGVSPLPFDYNINGGSALSRRERCAARRSPPRRSVARSTPRAPCGASAILQRARVPARVNPPGGQVQATRGRTVDGSRESEQGAELQREGAQRARMATRLQQLGANE